MEEEKKKKSTKDKAPKERSDKYEEKVSFDGTFDDLLALTIHPKKDNSEKDSKK